MVHPCIGDDVYGFYTGCEHGSVIREDLRTVTGSILDSGSDTVCCLLVAIADGGQGERIEVFAQFDVSMGMAHTHAAASDQSQVETQRVIPFK